MALTSSAGAAAVSPSGTDPGVDCRESQKVGSCHPARARKLTFRAVTRFLRCKSALIRPTKCKIDNLVTIRIIQRLRTEHQVIINRTINYIHKNLLIEICSELS